MGRVRIYHMHPHDTTLADGCEYATYEHDEKLSFDELVYIVVICSVCRNDVLVYSPVSAHVRKLLEAPISKAQYFEVALYKTAREPKFALVAGQATLE